jgi:GAF domain-containing protein
MALHRLALGETLVHVADVSGDDMYRSGEPGRVSFVEQAGARTTIWVALRKDDALLGALTIYRTEVRTFTEKQIALLQSFAAQAVIAMENARLITETREALDQQTATAEVLGVINSSPGDLTPVFDAMLERAVRLCEADSGHLALPDGDDYRTAAAFAMSPEMESLVRAQSYAPGRGTAVGRALLERCVVQIEDVGADNEHAARQVASKGLIRTVVGVPLLRDGEPIGAFGLTRSRVQPFTERQIALLQNFAAQAVIAMENARLITETREALEQQTATAEVLGVINSSPGDLARVFDAILEKAHALCGIAFGSLQLYEQGKVRAVAVRAIAEDLAELLRQPMEPRPGSSLSRLVAGERFVHNTDILN